MCSDCRSGVAILLLLVACTHDERCATTVALRADFEVPGEGGDSYPCFAFRSPFALDDHITSWTPIIDDARVTHHWLLYRTATPQAREGYIGECEPSGDGVLVMGWSPGGEGGALPEGVGLEASVMPDEWLILQMHYLDAGGSGAIRDRSGVDICVASRPQPVVAGIVTTGDVTLEIPPRSSGHTEERLCLQRTERPIVVVAASPHMHRLGTAIETTVRRGGPDAPDELVFREERFDYDAQTTYAIEPVEIRPGDVLRTACTYDNPGEATVRYGITTADEMCFNFLTVYPIDAFGDEPRVCR